MRSRSSSGVRPAKNRTSVSSLGHAGSPLIVIYGPPMERAGQSALHRAWVAGQARWPDLDLPYEAFAAHVQDLRASRSAPTDEELGQHAADLFLVAACLAGAPAALKAIDRAFLSQVPDMVAVVDPSYGF